MALVTFKKNNACIVRDCCPSLVSKLNSLLILDPDIVDGLGEKLVYEGGNLKPVAEIISLEWTNAEGARKEKSFSGYESYFLQFVVENL